MTCVYRHIRLDKNEPFYIGIGSIKRAYEKSRRNKYWKNIVNMTEYRVDILFEDLTWEGACEKEIEFIQIYGRKDLNSGTLVNMTDGGEGAGGRILSKETKLKISKAHKGRKHTNEAKKNMSLGQQKRTNWKQNRSNVKRGTCSELTKLKISKANKGRKVSDDTKLRQSEAASNRNYKKITGIYKIKLKSGVEKFIARYQYKDEDFYLGRFDTYEEAYNYLISHKLNNELLKNNNLK